MIYSWQLCEDFSAAPKKDTNITVYQNTENRQRGSVCLCKCHRIKTMKKHLSVISHTHWDREWYLPFEVFRMRLCDLMDHLLEILKTQPDYRFHLDAQTIVLEDYLELRPEKKPLLKKYVKEGRLLIGPWYVQNDFNLTSGEATVRNLMIGESIADEYGKCMRIAYTADQFGLVSQLPQIFKNIGFDFCVFGRGLNGPDIPAQLLWEGADGSVIQCELMKWWYNNSQRLPSKPELAINFIQRATNAMEPYMQTSSYLLMNGVDHLEAQEDILPILADIRSNLPDDCEISQDTLPEFAQRAMAEVKEKNIKLKTFKGELRVGGEDNVLTGTLSSRIYLKQANVRAQVALEKRVEPLYTLLDAKGIKEYPKTHLEYLWKLLIKNHPHDSICGCSVDAVHRQMVDRFERIEQNTDELISRGMQIISDHVDKKNFKDGDYILTVFNSVPYNGELPVEAEILTVASENVHCFKLIDSKGKEIPFSVSDITKTAHTSLSPINLPGEISVIIYKIRFNLAFSGVGYETLTVRPCEGEFSTQNIQNTVPEYMENEYLRCEINKNGTVTITEKESGKLYHGLIALEDHAESGDEYQHREPDGAPEYTSLDCNAAVTVLEDNDTVQRRKLTYAMKIDRDGEKLINVSAELTLCKRSRSLDVKLELDNTAKDHRIRVLFPTYLKTDRAYAGAPFDCVCRTLADDDNDRRQPNAGYIAFTDGKNGLAILNEGLYEYEHKKDNMGTVALTVLRSTGNLAWYKDQATLPKEWSSPEAQCLGKNTAHFAIYPFSGDIRDSGLFTEAELFNARPIIHSAPTDMRRMASSRTFVQDSSLCKDFIFFRETEHSEKKLPTSLRMLKLSGDNGRVQLSACKKAEKGSARIVRLYNPTDETVKFSLSVDKRLRGISVISADERLRYAEDLPFDGRKIPLTLKPKEIITLEIK